MRICILNLILKSSDLTDYDPGILVCKLISFMSYSVWLVSLQESCNKSVERMCPVFFLACTFELSLYLSNSSHPIKP